MRGTYLEALLDDSRHVKCEVEPRAAPDERHRQARVMDRAVYAQDMWKILHHIYEGNGFAQHTERACVCMCDILMWTSGCVADRL